MGNSFFFMNSKIGVLLPRFWMRMCICLLVSFEMFWYTCGFGADFNSLFVQELAFHKFLIFALGTILVQEWIFYACMFILPKFEFHITDLRFVTLMIGVVLLCPYIFMFFQGRFFIALFGDAMGLFVQSISLLNIFLILTTFFLTNLLVYLGQLNQFIRSLEVFYAGRKVVLNVSDIAYIFYDGSTYFITSHKGISYETRLEERLEEFCKLLNPWFFFKINEFTIVSRKACKDFSEDENGGIFVMLEPKPILPKSLRDKDDPGLFDFLNFN